MHRNCHCRHCCLTRDALTIGYVFMIAKCSTQLVVFLIFTAATAMCKYVYALLITYSIYIYAISYTLYYLLMLPSNSGACAAVHNESLCEFWWMVLLTNALLMYMCMVTRHVL